MNGNDGNDSVDTDRPLLSLHLTLEPCTMFQPNMVYWLENYKQKKTNF